MRQTFVLISALQNYMYFHKPPNNSGPTFIILHSRRRRTIPGAGALHVGGMGGMVHFSMEEIRFLAG